MNILQAQILTNDLYETEQFYSGVLGLQIRSKNRNMISFICGTSILTFIKSKELNPVYHVAFNIPCNKLDEALVWLSKRVDLLNIEGTTLIADYKSWNAKAIYFYDSAGNILEFITRNELNNKSRETFGSSGILSISEIAIVTDDVAKLVGRLIENEGLSLFSKQTLLEDFGVIGDDYGLLIIAKTGKHWFPTKVGAHKFYLSAKIQSGGLIKTLSFNEENLLTAPAPII